MTENILIDLLTALDDLFTADLEYCDHDEFSEITLGGNGYNTCEVSGALWYVREHLQVLIDAVKKDSVERLTLALKEEAQNTRRCTAEMLAECCDEDGDDNG